MKLRVKLLGPEEYPFSCEVSEDEIKSILASDSEEEDSTAGLYETHGAFHFDAKVFRNESDVFFSSTLKGSLKSKCVRCLEEGEHPLELEFGGVYCVDENGEGGEPENPTHYFYQGDELDFRKAIKENIFLNLSLHPTCSDRGDSCAGMSFSENKAFEEKDEKAIDPRWAGLMKIKKDLSSDKFN